MNTLKEILAVIFGWLVLKEGNYTMILQVAIKKARRKKKFPFQKEEIKGFKKKKKFEDKKEKERNKHAEEKILQEMESNQMKQKRKYEKSCVKELTIKKWKPLLKWN